MDRGRFRFLTALPLHAVACVLTLGLAGLCSAQPKAEAPPPDPTMVCALRVRNLGMGVMAYTQRHAGKLPPDLYSAAAAYAEATGKPVAEVARTLGVSPAHAGMIALPGEIDAPWMNERSSYRYLGNPDVVLDDVQEWGEIVIAHLRLEQGHQVEPTPENPTGEAFTLAFLDGHVVTAPRGEAERLVAKSVATLDALRDGTPLPDDRQAARNLATILKAVRAYATAHEGRLPPDLGATLEYVPRDTKATATGAQRARLYLSPKTRTSSSAPDEPTPEWVNANTWYVYLGGGDSPPLLEEIPEAHSIMLVHARLDDPFVVRAIDGSAHESTPMGTAGGRASVAPKGYVQWMARESEKTFRAVRTGEPLPDWVHAMRDVRLISEAVRGYTKAHDSRLPATLGETMAYLPERWPGGKAAGTPAQVYLSPRAESMATPPAAADAAWVTANGSYALVTAPGVTMAKVREMPNVVTVHSPLDESYRVVETYGEAEVVAAADAFGGCWMTAPQWVRDQAKAMKERLKAAQGAP